MWCGETRPGSVADLAQARRSGLVDLLSGTRGPRIPADAGYQGLGGQAGGQVLTAPRKRRGRNLEHLRWPMAHHDAARHAHSCRRIPVEHGIAPLKNRRALARHHGPSRSAARHRPGRSRASVRPAQG
ncbi:transposase family protein [Streptosporangium canum]|uniref:transposase family protein n=1 Tax=Streptosporangium canum TaxID=324952 RepID=UPI0037B4FD51